MSQSLQLLNSEILGVVSTVAGISRTPSEWSPADKSDMRQCIRRGLRKFYQPQPLPNSTIHQWRFLERKFYMAAETPYSNGVLNIASGTVIMVAIGPVWPTWSLDGVINAGTGGILYVTGVTGVADANRTVDNTATNSNSITFNGTTVTATAASGSATITLTGASAHAVVAGDVGKTLQITSGTNFITGQYTVVSVSTTANTWTLNAVCTTGVASAMAGATGFPYTIYRYRYPLPSDFAEFIGAVTYSGNGCTRLLKNTDDKEVRLRYGTNFRTDGHVSMYSIQHGKSSEADVANATTGSDPARWYISFWPPLGTGGSVTSIYRASPLDNLDVTDITDVTPDYAQVDPVHAETLMAAILSAVDEIYNDRMDGIYHQLFLTRLEASIAHDRHSQGNQDFWGGQGHNGRFNARAYSLLYHVPAYDVV